MKNSKKIDPVFSTITPLLDKILNKFLTNSELAGEILAKNKYNSVINIAKLEKQRFIKKFDQPLAGFADKIYQEAENYAMQILQDYRDSQALNISFRTLQFSNSPTWENMFKEDLKNFCKPNTIEADNSPAAYVVELHDEIEDIESCANIDVIKLKERRPDLAQLVLNETNCYQEIPTIVLVNEILCSAIQHNIGQGKDIYDVLAKTYYPFKLPYNKWIEQINTVLNAYNFNLGTLIEKADISFPYFLSSSFSKTSHRASLVASHISLELQSIILSELNENMLCQIFGLENYTLEDALKYLSVSKQLAKQTDLNEELIDALLSQGAYQPTVTNSYKIIKKTALQKYYGSAYLNCNNEILKIHKDLIINLKANHLQRISNLIRLQKIFKLPFDQLDWMIQCTCQAKDNEEINISTATFYILGLYKQWNTFYNVDAKVFSALIWRICPYAIGKDISFFDKLFSEINGVRSPLLVNGKKFKYKDPTDFTIQKLCGSLRINFNNLTIICELINQYSVESIDEEVLSCDLATISSIYRLVELPRIFNLTPQEGLIIINLLNYISKDYVKAIIQAVAFSSDNQQLNIITGLKIYESLVMWLKHTNINPLLLQQILALDGQQPILTPILKEFFNTIKMQIGDVLITKIEDLPPLPLYDDNNMPIEWLGKLNLQIDKWGLIQIIEGNKLELNLNKFDSLYTYDQESLKATINSLNLSIEVREEIFLSLHLFITSRLDMQSKILFMAISHLFKCDLNIITLLLKFIDISPYALLTLILQLEDTDDKNLIDETKTQNLVDKVYKIGRYIKTCELLELNEGIFKLLLCYPNLLSSDITINHNLDLNTLYYLDILQNLLNTSTSAEINLHYYFSIINSLEFDKDTKLKALALIVDWDIKSLQQAYKHLGNKLVSNLVELAWLIRLKQLCNKLNIPVLPILLIKGKNQDSFPTNSELQSLANSLIINLAEDKNYQLADISTFKWGGELNFEEKDGATFLIDPEGNIIRHKGIHIINGKKYYFNNDNSIVTAKGPFKIENNIYYFNDDYSIFTGTGINNTEEGQYYFNDDNTILQASGPQKIGDKVYYFNNDNTIEQI